MKLKTTPRAVPTSGLPKKAAADLDLPFQQWRYRFIEGVGKNVIIEFVDPTYTNEFRMTTDPSEKDALRDISGTYPGNSFVSVGGDPVVTVNARTMGPRITTVNVEQNAMEGRWDFTMNVVSNGKTAANLRDFKTVGAAAVGTRFNYSSNFTLAAGSYTLNVTVKDPTGATQTKSVTFYVN